MQSIPINAAQLMMEFLDREQTDIGQGIITSEFSKELENQQLKLGETSRGKVQKDFRERSGLASVQAADSIKSPLNDATSARENISIQRVKSLKRLVSGMPPRNRDRLGICEEIYLPDLGLLEKVLADLKVPAEARKACKGSEDKEGRLSLHDFFAVMEQHSTNKSILAPGNAAGQDVATLVGSIFLAGGREALDTRKLIDKPNGLYTLDELKQVLEKTVEQVQAQKAEQCTSALESSNPIGSSHPSIGTLQDHIASSGAPDQSAHLMNSSVPSFLEDDVKSKGKGLPSQTFSPPGESLNDLGDDIAAEKREAPRGGTRTTDGVLLSVARAGLAAGQGDPASRGFEASLQTEAPSDASQYVKMAVQGASDHPEQVSLSALEDLLKRASGDATRNDGKRESMPADRLEVFRVATPASPDGMTEGKTWERGSEPSFTPSKLRECDISPSLPGNQGEKGMPSPAALIPVSENLISANETGMLMRGETQPAPHASWRQQMLQYIHDLTRESRTACLTLHLEPGELGRLMLRVGTRSEEVTAFVSADKEHTREILLQNAPALRRQLEEQGLTLSQFMVDVHDGRKDGGAGTEEGFPGSNQIPPDRAAVGKDISPKVPGIHLISNSENCAISVFV